MTDYANLLGATFTPSFDKKKGKKGFAKGVENISNLPELSRSNFVPGKPYEEGEEADKGVMGLRNIQKDLRIAIAYGKMQVRFLPLAKYVALVEQMHDEDSASILLQNFSDQEDGRMARGQVLARLDPKHSAITVIQGVTGRLLRNPRDIALYDVYYLDKKDLMAFYVAAKFQISTEDQLDSLIAAYEGWKAYKVPLNPLDPYDEAGRAGDSGTAAITGEDNE